MTVGFRRHYDLGDTPVALLDATGDRELTERILDRAVEDVHVRAKLEDHQAVQIADAKYARSTLFAPTGKLNPGTWRRLRRFLVARCNAARNERHGLGKTLIITYKAMAAKLMAKGVLDELGGDERVTITWFWGNRGRDYSDHDQVILLGYPFPSEDAVIDLAAVLYEGEDIDTTTTTIWRAYLAGDGKLGLDVRVFEDPRVQTICDQLREAEYTQSIMRIRPLERPWKRIVLLSQIPVLPEHDIHLAAVVATSELFAEEQTAHQTRQEVRRWVTRFLDRHGWVGLPWIASLCRGGFTPTPPQVSLLRSTGGKPPSPLEALLPSWEKAIKEMISAGHGISFNLQGGKRSDRLLRYFESELPPEVEACRMSLQRMPPPKKGGRPWSATIYTRGVEGRFRFLECLRMVAGSGLWQLKIEGVVHDGDALHQLVGRLKTNPTSALSVITSINAAKSVEEFIGPMVLNEQ